MALIVQKFGGTSVGTLERIYQVADIVLRAKAAGDELLVVLSAMAGETDRLIELANSITTSPAPREYATLVSTGEQVSVALLALILQSKGCHAQSFLGFQLPILTDDHYRKARILDIDCEALITYLQTGGIPIVAGFQGVNAKGEITTLGRGGSDTSAVALAHALQAKECQIYTDVAGVFTTDPRVVPQAQCLHEMRFDEMIELASLGTKVLQSRAVEFAAKYHVPLRVLSSFEAGQGTLVSAGPNRALEQPLVSGIAFNRKEAKFILRNVPDQAGIAAKILGPIGQAGYDIDMIIQNAPRDGLTDLSFTVHRDEYEAIAALLAPRMKAMDPGIEINTDNTVSKLSIVGVGIRSHASVASKLFEALAAVVVNIQLLAMTEIKISVIIEEALLDKSVQILHESFALSSAKPFSAEP